MGLFSKKNESENTISQEILDAIQLSTLDYVPGYKVVKSFGTVAAWSSGNNPINETEKEIKEIAYKVYPECNGIIGMQCNISSIGVGQANSTPRHTIFYAGTAVRLEPES